jgi:hypothetical protein
MDKQTLVATLNSHITGSRLDLPIDALQSDPIRQQLSRFMPGENLIIDPISSRPEDATSATIIGAGGNTLFKGTTVTARFTAGEPAQLVITTQNGDGWLMDRSFPELEYTLVSGLPFKGPAWRLASTGDGAQEAGLSFQGTMDTANGLGLFIFLIGNTDEVLAGKVSAVTSGIPTMRLAGGVRGATSLGFLTLGPINLALFTAALQPRLQERPIQPSVGLEVSTSLNFTAQGHTRAIPLRAEIREGSSAIRLDAEITQLIDAGLDELKALTNSVGWDGFSFGEFKLEDVVKLTQLTCIVDPLEDSKLTSVAMTVASAKPWDLLTRANGTPFLSLQNIRVGVGMSAPFTSADLSALLHGEVVISGARLIIEAMVAPANVQLQGYLDTNSRLSLRDVAGYFLGEVDPHTPALIITELDLMIQPKQHYELAFAVQDLWSIQLGDAQLHLKSIDGMWSYTVGGSTDARLTAVMQVGGVDIVTQAAYETSAGWTFSAALAEGQTVLIGDVLGDLLYYFNADVPAFMNSIEITTLSIRFNPTSKNFDFTIGGDLTVDDKQVDILVKVAITHADNKFSFLISGTLTIGAYQFQVADLHTSGENIFVATYQHTGQPASLPLRAFVSEHLSTAAAQFVPNEVHIDVKDVLFAMDSTDDGNRFLFALDLATDINLSNLPLVGQTFPPEQTVGVDDLQIVIASTDFVQGVVSEINRVTAGHVTPLPDTVASGLTFQAMFQFGDGKQSLALPVAQTTGGQQPSTTRQDSAIVTSTDNTKWFTLQRSFGPVHFERIGVAYRDNELWFLLDGSFAVGGLTIGLEGLGFGSPLTVFRPDFTLQGLAIDYTSSAVAISGAFLKSTLVYPPAGQPGSKTYTAYSGKAVLKAETLTIGALGSYVQLDEGPSLFVYAFLDYPIGGPAFFFVRGLAAGFGYNRRLISPTVDRIADFPLVAEASGQMQPGSLADELSRLQSYLPPSIGDYFLAVGIRFTTFEMIDTFILVAVAFGHRFELNILGLSTMILPAPDAASAGVTPLAEIQLALRATFVPDDGFFGISAQLTPNSFLLSRDCHLTGGFAFYSWFGDQNGGDFVLSVGGYHPRFSRPAHYPLVPRLGFNWQVNSQLLLKGSAYYALTPSMLMAGGALNATWQDGNLKAWFDASMDFLIAWKPFHYEVDFHISVGASYTFHFFGTHHITAHVGADVNIWGPEFSGQARVDLSIVSFTIRFIKTPKGQLQAQDWAHFRQSFLPEDNKVCTIAIRGGMAHPEQAADAAPSGDALVMINPHELVLATDSVIPSKAGARGVKDHDTALPTTGATLTVGVGPMNRQAVEATHRIIITHGNDAADDWFEYHPLTKSLPFALWGGVLRPALNQPQLVANMLTGYEVRPKAPLEPSNPPTIARSALQKPVPVFTEHDAFEWKAPAAFVAVPDDEIKRRDAIGRTIVAQEVAARRTTIASALLADAVLDLGGFDTGDFLAIPLVSNDSPA